jgi:hypothetical protein
MDNDKLFFEAVAAVNRFTMRNTIPWWRALPFSFVQPVERLPSCGAESTAKPFIKDCCATRATLCRLLKAFYKIPIKLRGISWWEPLKQVYSSYFPVGLRFIFLNNRKMVALLARADFKYLLKFGRRQEEELSTSSK